MTVPLQSGHIPSHTLHSGSISLSFSPSIRMHMGQYAGGDVLLAAVCIGGEGRRKVRPVVVVSAGKGGNLLICPVSSNPSIYGVSVPLSLDDFVRGGLDLFTESYALAAYATTIQQADVVGKKGVLLPETMVAIRGAIPPVHGKKERRW